MESGNAGRTEVFLHDQRNRASQHRGAIGWHDPRERVRERSLCHDFRDDGTDPIPYAGDFPDDDDDFRREPGDQSRETDAEEARRAVDRLAREPIVFRRQPQQLGRTAGPAPRVVRSCLRRRRPPRCSRPPPAAAARSASRSTARRPNPTRSAPSIPAGRSRRSARSRRCRRARTHRRASRRRARVVRSAAGRRRRLRRWRPRAGCARARGDGRTTARRGRRRSRRSRARPARRWPIRASAAGRASPHPRLGANTRRPARSARPGRPTPMPSTRICGWARRNDVTVRFNCATNACGSFGVGHVGLHEEARVDAGESHRRGLRPEIHGQNPGLLDVQVQEPRPPSAQGMTHRAFDHPAFFDQLIDDGRDRAPLQPRMPGKIGPRQRLVTPDEVQRDPAVDLPRRLTAGELKARQVDLAHVLSSAAEPSRSPGGYPRRTSFVRVANYIGGPSPVSSLFTC